MKLTLAQLDPQLKKNLAPIYVVSGDEPLLLQEACDLIRRTATAQSFGERITLTAEPHFAWEQLLNEANSLSLFAAKKILDLRVPSGKPGTAGSKILKIYAEQPPPGTILLIQMPKLDAKTMQSDWYKSLDKAGVTLPIWPIENNQLPQWIMQRAKQNGVTLTLAAAKTLAELVEGNLLAAAQEIEKLSLLQISTSIDPATLVASMTDNARFDSFDLVDSALLGDAKRCVRILKSLRTEAAEPVLILWAITRELRALAEMSQQLAQGINLATVFNQFRVWEKRKACVSAFLSRNSLKQCLQFLLQAAAIDRQIKGAAPGNVWDSLATLNLKMAGVAIMNAYTD